MNSLQNPIWNSLSTRHAHLALEQGFAKKYPSGIAPFAAIQSSTLEASQDLLALIEPGEKVGVLSIQPVTLEGWIVQKEFDIYQYVWQGQSPQPDPEAILLGPQHLDSMLELTGLVYPAYFRKGTAELGDYFGIIENGQLCAMAGIRMAMTGFQELSAICTHPDHRGRGLASRLTNHLVRQIVAQGETPFLHTEHDNKPAQAIYERLGFELNAVLPFRVMERTSTL